jgi:hypothetical protein
VSLIRNHQEHPSIITLPSEPHQMEASLLQRLQRLDNER